MTNTVSPVMRREREAGEVGDPVNMLDTPASMVHETIFTRLRFRAEWDRKAARKERQEFISNLPFMRVGQRVDKPRV